MLILLAAVVVVTALAAGVIRLTHLTGARATGLPAVGRVIPAAARSPGPDISGTTLTGAPLDLARWRGAPVVVNFWGSWCAPCRAEAPVLARVARDTRRLGVHFAGVDVREGPAAGLAFGRDYRIAYPSLSDPDNLIAARFGAVAPTATPATYILDARGRIAWAWFGRTYFNQLETAVVQVTGR